MRASLLLAFPLSGCIYVSDVQSETTDFAFPEPVSQVIVQSDSGAVFVRGGDRAGVEGSLFMEWGGDAPEVDVWLDGDALYVEARCPGWGRCTVEPELSVPFGASVRVETGSGGVEVSDIDGAVSVSTGSGGVMFTRVNGDVIADTGSGGVSGIEMGCGRIEVEASSGGVDLSMRGEVDEIRVDTGSGGVSLAVPAGRYRVDAEASSGDVVIDNITVDRQAESTIWVEASSGGIEIWGR